MKPNTSHITPVVVGLVRRSDGKYLMTDRMPGDPLDDAGVVKGDFWQFPGGAIELGETPEVALHREMKEEVGLEVKIVSFIPKVFTSLRNKWHGLLLYYVCHPVQENFVIKLNHEASRYDWFDAKTIQSLRSFPDTKVIVNLAEKI